jgi:predicted metal-dependent hydrolase
MTDFIFFGSQKINYSISFSTRKTLGITVTPDFQVFVKAPIATDLDLIKVKVSKKAPWIIKQQSFFLSFHPKQALRKYISGETHLFLGRQYLLKVQVGEKEEVTKKGRELYIIVKKRENAEKLLKKWYFKIAKDKFPKIAIPLIQKFEKYSVKPDSIVIRDMPTRWGSCTPKGKIILNPELIKAPKGCIEYVILHELCHLVHHDHTQKFFDLQTKQMPTWPKWKNKLEKLLA